MNGSKPQTEPDAEALSLAQVEAFYAAMRRGDVPAVLALADDRVVVTQSARLPWGGRFEGRAGLSQFAAGVRKHIASEVFVERVVAAGERVAVSGWSRGTTLETGHTFEVPLVHLFTVAGGKIASLEVLVDVPAMKVALAWGQGSNTGTERESS